ncbi:MAG TPA: FHA domain-containing protein [Kofleriaceae bacterium]
MALQLAITGEGIGRLVELQEGELTIGRSGLNTIVLDDGTISPRHARIIQRGTQTTLADLASDNGTYVNGARLVAPHALTVGDQVQIGHVTIDVRVAASPLPAPPPPQSAPPFSPRGPEEIALLVQIGEQGSRDVYADWLDDHGHAREAGFVRAQDELVQLRATRNAQAHDVRRREVGAMATRLDYPWRRHVSRSSIERCAREFAFRCPKEWGGLARTDKPGVRFCDACQKPVYYVASIAEGREHAANNECVALDLSAERAAGDLDGPYGLRCRECGRASGTSGDTVCKGCGAELRYVAMLGAIAPLRRR